MTRWLRSLPPRTNVAPRLDSLARPQQHTRRAQLVSHEHYGPDARPASHERHTPDARPASHEHHTPDARPASHEHYGPDARSAGHEQQNPDAHPVNHEHHTPDARPAGHEQQNPDAHPVNHEHHTPDARPAGHEQQNPDAHPVNHEHRTPDAYVVCFPHAGGGAASYRRWPQTASASIEVLAVQPPGRDDRITEPSTSCVEQMADAVATELAEWPHRRLALFGHSFGAIVAYEVARRLERPPVLLVVAAASPPPVPHTVTALAELDDERLAATLIRRGALPAAVGKVPELLALLLAPIRSDLKALSRYRHDAAPRLACAVRTLAGADDADASPLAMRSWSALTDGPTTAATFPGGHLFAVERPHDVARDVAGAVLAASA